jgi:hypothetical protein
MATEAEILTKVSDLLDAYSGMLSPVGGSKLLTLDRAAGSDAALSRLREGGAERWRYGMLAGDDDFVLQWSTDGSELGYVDRFRIDGATGAVTIAGLALDGASFADTTFTGQSLFDPGSAAAPAIAAAGDVDTGLFFPAADQIAAVSGGEVRWLADASGRVGIGTGLDAPRRRLHLRLGNEVGGTEDVNTVALIERDANALLYIKTPPTAVGGIFFGTNLAINTGQIRYDHNSNYMSLWTNASERVRIDASGNVGIYTSSPAYKLDVNGDVRANFLRSHSVEPYLELYETDGAASHNRVRVWLTGNKFYIARRTGADAFVSFDYVIDANASGATSHQWLIGNSEKMRIDSLGRLGVNTSSPSYQLEVNGALASVSTTAQVVALSGDLTNHAFVRFRQTASESRIESGNGGTYSAVPMTFLVAGAEAARFDIAGNLLIGTTTTGGSKLRVADLPTSAAGLSTGDIWNDGGTLKVAA